MIRSRAISSMALSTSHLYISTSLEPKAVDTYIPVSPPMWKNGKTCNEAGWGRRAGGRRRSAGHGRQSSDEGGVHDVRAVVAMRGQGTLGRAGGAGGVEDGGVVLRLDLHVGQREGQVERRSHVVPGLEPGGQVAPDAG